MDSRERQTSLPGFEPEPPDPPARAPGGSSHNPSNKAVQQPSGATAGSSSSDLPENLARTAGQASSGTHFQRTENVRFSAKAFPSPPSSPGPTPASLQGQTVWVVDSHSLIHQVFHALPEMTSPRGEPVAAVYGFSRDLLYLWAEKRPDFLFCAFDLPGKTFRHDLFADYKIHRAEMPDDLVPQIASIRRVIDAMGIPAVGCPAFEADDVMATIAHQVELLGGHCLLVTADKDCRQLISERVKIYNIRKNQVYDRDALRADWGIEPRQVVDFQALVGDSVDNVPGVPLIGPKLARELLEKYDTLENVLDHAGEISGTKRRENLLRCRDQALLSRRLVELDRRVPIAIDWEAGRLDFPDLTPALELFREFGFRSLGEQLQQIEPGHGRPVAMSPAAEPTYHTVDTPEALDVMVAELRQQKCISVDSETTSVWPRWAEIVGLSFAWKDDEAWYVPVRGPVGARCLDLGVVLDALRPMLEDPTIEKIGQNLKYDTIVLRNVGINLAGVAFDSMIAAYLLDPGQRNHGLDDLAKRYLHHHTIKIEELIGSGKNQRRMDEVAIDRVTDYAGEDALLPLRLRPLLEERLAEEKLDDLFARLEIPLVEVLVELETNGIRVDVGRLGELSGRYGERMETLEREIFELAGHSLNLASPKQLQQVLFEELKLPVVKKTKTGPSTDAEVLEELAAVHPLPAKLIEFRQYAKLKSTYVDALPQMVHPETGRVHASFNQHVTATGRLSSSDPNLQNIPVRTDEGREIRSAFVPGHEGWLLLAADYSQIELRVLAHFSGDDRMTEAFAHDEDIHARVASQVNGVPLDEVTPAMRRAAKAVNFGVIYGQSPFGLAKSLGIDKDEAARFIDGYFDGYPGVERFLGQLLADCRKKGHVETILGRRRAIRGVRPDAGRQKNLAERTAINTVIQGSAADLIKMAMIAVLRRLRKENSPAKMLLQIHDELVFETPAERVDELALLVTEEMAGVMELNVPLKVDVKVGPNWADARGV